MDTKQMRSQVIQIAWPALVELLLAQLCLMVDMMMVGRYGQGGWAVAAVGYCSQPIFLLLSTFIALNTGATALISRAYGSDNQKEANIILGQCLFMTFLLGILVSILGFFSARFLVVTMGAKNEQTIQAATSYLQIQMIFFLSYSTTLAITACLRGIGKTRVSMVYNLISNLVNLLFDWLLIYGHWGFPELGVSGAGIATVMGQVVAAVIAFWVILKKDGYLWLQWKWMKPAPGNVSYIKKILAIGLPAMLEQLIMRAGMVIYILTITALGETLFATHQIAATILTLSFMNGQAFGIAATSLMGQSLGRKRPDQAKAYTLQCRQFAVHVSFVLVFVFFFLGKPLLYLFTDDKYIIQEGAKILKVVAVLQPLQASQLVINGALRGAGDTIMVALITFICILIIRPLTSFTLIHYAGMGLLGAWIAMSIDQSMRSLFSILRLNSGKWEK